MTRFKLTIEYDGTGLAGWQVQDDRESVQGLLQEAAGRLTGAPCDVVGAGRTDAGVHALAQVAHLDIERKMAPYNVMQGLNYHLAPLTDKVIVLKAEPARDDFHARFHATARSYCYRIINRPARIALDLHRAWHIHDTLDVRAMHEAAQRLVGHHDFSTFRSSECQSKSPEKTLDRLDVTREGEEIRIVAGSRSFLHHQVRNMVGSLRLVGNGKWTVADLVAALEAKDRKRGGETAPAQGLYLTQVLYDN
jgi:tRNA pseudouridine38-40 synthase